MADLVGMTVLVTGALGRLGRAVVAAIEAAGGTPLAGTRDRDRAAAFDAEAAAEGRRGRAVVLPLDDEAALRAALASIVAAHGPVAGLVNNAYAAQPWRSVEAAGFADWAEAMGIGVAAPHRLAADLAETGALRSVVNVASIYALRAPHFPMYPPGHEPNPLVYGPAKAALLALTRYLAAYWGPQGIRVNAVAPGGIRDAQGEAFLARYAAGVPAGRMVTAGEVAAAILFLLSPAAAGITGETVTVDAGRTVW